MTEQNVPPPQAQGSGVGHVIRTLPSWKRKLIGISLVMGAVGAGGQLASSSLQSHPTPPVNSSGTPAANATPTDAPPAPNGARGFVSSTPAPKGDAPATPPAIVGQDTSPTMTQRVSPWMTRVGLSFFVGIVVGLVSRMFLKIAAGITVLIGGVILALSYFHVLNVDMSSVKTEYASASAWLGDQAVRLKDMVLHALPSTSSAAAGFLSGFKRR
ncbi:MAG TPA: FUN14 domain-containing protein [Tepidisphaeraceae bacterium]|nr:FUN14 domain-containing protein [Tepidisphaeraceae bacterium]